MKTKDRDVVFLLGLPFNVMTMENAIEDAVDQIEARNPAYYITANVDFITQAYSNEFLKNILFHADRVVCDGMPLVWLSRFFKAHLPERVTGADMVFKLFAEADKRKWKVFFLGSDDSTLTQAKVILSNKYPDMRVVGHISPPFGSIDSWPNDAILNEVLDKKPDLLLVAVGCPKQEYWISKYYKESRVPLSIGIGASLDFICGKQIRAPLWIQKIGMEWMWRLATNPTRLFKRYAKGFYYLFLLGYRQWQLTRTSSKLSFKESDNVMEGSAIEEKDGSICYLEWGGEVDRVHLDEILLPTDYSKPVFLDLSKVSFIDSSGIGKLAKIARDSRQANVAFGIINPSEIVDKIIETMHLKTQFPVYESLSDAKKSVLTDSQ